MGLSPSSESPREVGETQSREAAKWSERNERWMTADGPLCRGGSDAQKVSREPRRHDDTTQEVERKLERHSKSSDSYLTYVPNRRTLHGVCPTWATQFSAAERRPF